MVSLPQVVNRRGQRRHALRAATLLLLASACPWIKAASYQVDQAVIAVAEGVSGGGSFSVTGGLRPGANETLANADFQLSGSFGVWMYNHAPFAAPDIVTRP